ncbi:hypothetical protein ACFVUS_24185 [Nocardia sp. NPDC058058]|uniref:hypothetical protein n=1 Tax=Nocardia sp. NPDC058058 TaxID=3346317 RepID=UPI0036D81590
MTVESPHPGEQDVHISVQLAGIRFDFAACLSAALLFVHEWLTLHYPEHVTIVRGSTAGLPRLPNERLYLDS